MSDDSGYRLALVRREKILEELKELNQFIAYYERVFLKRVGSPSNDLFADFFSAAGMPATPAEVADGAERILNEVGRPMTRGELAKSLESAGLRLVAADKNKNVGTVLWRHPNRFVNLRKHGYWLRDRPYEPLGYVPGKGPEYGDEL